VNIALGSILPVTLSPPENRRLSPAKSQLLNLRHRLSMSPPPPSLRTITLRLQNKCYHQPSISMSFVFKLLQIPFSATPMFSHLYKTLGGGAHFRSLVTNHGRASQVTNEQPTPFHQLARSCVALLRSCNAPILCFQQLARSFHKTPGVGGTPPASFGSSSPTQRPPLPPDSLCESRAPVAQSSPQITPWRNHARPPR
jgi:hypothetical protein